MNGFNKHTNIPKEFITQLADNKIVLENIVASNKEVKKLIKRLKTENGQQAQLLSKVNENNKLKDTKLDEVGIIVSKLNQRVDLIERGSDHIYESDNVDLYKHKQYFKKIYSEDTNGNKFPVAWAIFLPNQPEDKQWKTGVYPIEYHVTVVETDSENGTFDRYAEIHIENNQMKETIGKEYPITLTDIEWEKFENKTRRFYPWNPRIGLGIVAGSSLSTGLDFSIASYGRTKRDMDWRFMTVGVGVASVDGETEGVFCFEPVSWNFGNMLPIIENMFVGPAGIVDTKLNYGGALKVSIPF